MSVDGFVRMSGALMGIARESFGTGADAGGSAAVLAPPPGAARSAAGSSAAALDIDSDMVGAQVAGLGRRDALGSDELSAAAAAARTGRDRVDGVISAAGTDVERLAPLTDTPQGRAALIDALTRRLDETKGVLGDATADAATRAAATSVSAAGYDCLGRFPAVGAPPAAPVGIPPIPAAPPVPAMSPVAWTAVASPLTSLAQFVSCQARQQVRNPAPNGFAVGNAPGKTDTATDSERPIQRVVDRALAQRGLPYAYGGGSAAGPSRGDDGDVGFDCSSLVQFAYAGAGVDLPRTTYDQIGLGQQVPRHAIRAGDLIFSNFDSRGPGHVQLAISPTQTVEAPNRNGHVQISAVPAGPVVVKRILT